MGLLNRIGVNCYDWELMAMSVQAVQSTCVIMVHSKHNTALYDRES